MSRTIVKHRYVRAYAFHTPSAKAGERYGAQLQLRSALRYLERRRLGAEERENDRNLFDHSRDGIRRTDAVAALAAHTTEHLSYHRLILSPGLSSETVTRVELVCWTRRIIADMEARIGDKVAWIAAVHQHSAHSHVHVLVGAATCGASKSRKTVRFTPDDYALLRESGDRWADRARNDRALWDEVERYLVQVAGATIAGVARHSAAQGQRDADDEEDERLRRDGRSR